MFLPKGLDRFGFFNQHCSRPLLSPDRFSANLSALLDLVGGNSNGRYSMENHILLLVFQIHNRPKRKFTNLSIVEINSTGNDGAAFFASVFIRFCR